VIGRPRRRGLDPSPTGLQPDRREDSCSEHFVRSQVGESVDKLRLARSATMRKRLSLLVAAVVRLLILGAVVHHAQQPASASAGAGAEHAIRTVLVSPQGQAFRFFPHYVATARCGIPFVMRRVVGACSTRSLSVVATAVRSLWTSMSGGGGAHSTTQAHREGRSITIGSLMSFRAGRSSSRGRAATSRLTSRS